MFVRPVLVGARGKKGSREEGLVGMAPASGRDDRAEHDRETLRAVIVRMRDRPSGSRCVSVLTGACADRGSLGWWFEIHFSGRYAVRSAPSARSAQAVLDDPVVI